MNHKSFRPEVADMDIDMGVYDEIILDFRYGGM